MASPVARYVLFFSELNGTPFSSPAVQRCRRTSKGQTAGGEPNHKGTWKGGSNTLLGQSDVSSRFLQINEGEIAKKQVIMTGTLHTPLRSSISNCQDSNLQSS